MIQSLQSLRGIFAIFIFLFHFTLYGCSVMPSGGFCGVVFFIMLSGFVMSAGYGDKVLYDNFDVKRFVVKRMRRIYPLHLIGFVLWGIFISNHQPCCFKRITSNLILIQAWIPDCNYYFSCNGVSWCLSVLLLCYILFPFIIKCLSILSFKRTFGIVLFLMSVYILICMNIPRNYIHWAIYINPVMRLMDFIIGILLWKLYRRLKSLNINLSKKTITLIQTLSIFTLVISMYYYNRVPLRCYFVSYWWLPSALIILAFALFDEKETIFVKLLKSRILLLLGKISFSLYILHQLIIDAGSFYLSRFGWSSNNFVSLFLFFSLSIIMSYFLGCSVCCSKNIIQKHLKF